MRPFRDGYAATQFGFNFCPKLFRIFHEFGRLNNCSCGQKITSATRIGLNLKFSAVTWKSFDQFGSHRDVRRFFGVLANDIHGPSADFRAEEQGGGELGAFRDVDGAFGAGFGAAAVNDGGEFVRRRIDAVAKFAQGLEQGGFGAFVHARDTVQFVDAFAEADERGEEARGGAGVADEEFHRLLLGAAGRDGAAFAVDRDGAVGKFVRVGPDVDHEAEFLQAFDHDLRVLAPERTFEGDFAFGEGGEDQGAVGDALRAWHGDFRAHGFFQRNNFDEVGERHFLTADERG